MPAGGLVTASIIGAGMALYGGVKQSQAEKRAQANIANRPLYKPTEDSRELNLAESQANLGMGASARQAMINNQQGTTAGITNAALMGGADPNALAGIAASGQQALSNAAIYDDQVRQSHLSNLLQTYRADAARKRAEADKMFQINKYAPWADEQQLYGQQQQAGQNMMMSGINSFTKSLVGLGGLPGGTDPDITLGRNGDNMSSLPISGGYGNYPATPPPQGFMPYHQVPSYP